MKKLVYLGLIVLVFSTSACQSTAGANAQSSSNAELRNTLWKLTELGGKTVLTQEAQRMASLTLASEESRARIVTACNSGSASFTVDGKSLKFAAVMATKMGCSQDRMEEEAALLSVIANTVRYEIKGEILELFDANSKKLASFHSEYL